MLKLSVRDLIKVGETGKATLENPAAATGNRPEERCLMGASRIASSRKGGTKGHHHEALELILIA
jgi:hypothetical protein